MANALLHLYDLVPNVGRLYPQAGQELWRAVNDVEPLLRGQVERLASLDRLEWEMPDSRAAEAAIAAGTDITGRLRGGADALEDLLAAAARMLAAPDIGDGVPDALAPAIDSLDAFGHGLNAANAAARSCLVGGEVPGLSSEAWRRGGHSRSKHRQEQGEGCLRRDVWVPVSETRFTWSHFPTADRGRRAGALIVLTGCTSVPNRNRVARRRTSATSPP